MRKNKQLLIRVSDEESATMTKAARDHKSVAAFILFAVDFARRYHTLLSEIWHMERIHGSKRGLIEAAALAGLKALEDH